MPWNCPACGTAIAHEREYEPRDGARYRCTVCRLELVADAAGRLTLAPLDPPEPPAPPKFTI